MFNIASAVSLVLCAATATLWMSSYWRDMSIDLTRHTLQLSVRCLRGQVVFEEFRPDDGFSTDQVGVSIDAFPAERAGASDFEWAISDSLSATKWKSGGMGFYIAGATITPTVQRWLVLPAWFLALVLGLPLIRLRRQVAKDHDGSCLGCGYNLTGNTSGVCPECGTALNP